MSHFNVVNVNARSVKISTTPSKYLTEVRDEACQKFGYTTKDNYTLKFNNKPVLLSQQVRLANLPAGARLELIQASRSPTVISVALQLPNSRLTDKFASNTSLWTILRSFESPGKQNTYNFTDRSVEIKVTSGAGRVYYQMPVITVMPSHKEYSTFVDLQQTLSQLGFDGGSALLKLSFKDTDIPWEEAIIQISQYFKTDDPTTAGSQGAHAATSSQQSSVPDPATAAPAASEVVAGQATKNDAPDPEPMEIDSKPAAEPVQTPTQVTTENTATSNIENVSPGAALSAATSSSPAAAAAASTSSPDGAHRPRNVQIFSAPTSSTPTAARSGFNENDYQPSIEHAKSHLAALQTRTRNTRLLSDKELAEQEEAHKAKLAAAAAKGGVIRIRMPDGVYIQIPVTKADTAATLYDATRACLEKKHEPFKLNYTGPTGRLVHFPSDSKLLFQDLKFYNNELLTFQWAENASEEARTTRSALASDWAAKAQPLKVEDPSAGASDEASSSGNTGKGGQTVAEGKKKVLSSEEKESKLKSLLGKGLFKKK